MSDYMRQELIRQLTQTRIDGGFDKDVVEQAVGLYLSNPGQTRLIDIAKTCKAAKRGDLPHAQHNVRTLLPNIPEPSPNTGFANMQQAQNSGFTQQAYPTAMIAPGLTQNWYSYAGPTQGAPLSNHHINCADYRCNGTNCHANFGAIPGVYGGVQQSGLPVQQMNAVIHHQKCTLGKQENCHGECMQKYGKH